MSDIFVADKSKLGNETCKDCLEPSFSTSEKLTEDEYHQSDREDVRTSLGYLHRGTEMFKEQQNKREFPCQMGFSGNLLNVSYGKCMSTVMSKHNSLLMYDKKGQSLGDYFLDGKFPAAESLCDNVPFDAPSSSHERKFLKVDADMINESFEGDLLYDSHGFCNDVEVNRDFQKPFLKSCSTRGSILHEKAFFLNDKHEFQTDSFWSKQDLGEDCGSVKDLCAQGCPEVAKSSKMSRDSGFFLRAMAEDPPYSYYSATQTINSGSDDLLLTSEWHPVCQEPSSQATAWGVNHTADINDLGGTCRVSRYYKRVHRTKLLDDKENECDFSYNISRNAKQDYCTSSFDNSGFEFTGAVDSNKIFNTIVDWPDCGYKYSTRRPDVLNEESEWLLPDTRVEKCRRPNKNKGKMDHSRHLALEKNHERSTRSFSAPPFHKRKRRFISLNQPSEMTAKRPTGQASNPAFNHQGFPLSSIFPFPSFLNAAMFPFIRLFF